MSPLELAWYRARRTLRTRAGALVTIAVLLGLIGGLALGAIAAARRTQAAFPAFLASSAASDLQLQPFSVAAQDQGVAAATYTPALTRKLTRVPGVRAVGATVAMFIVPLDHHGRPLSNTQLGNSEVQEIGGVNGEYQTQDRVVAEQGRLPDPHALGDVVVTADSVRLLHWHLGQVISMGAYTFAQLADPGPAAAPPFLRFEATVVGIVAFSATVVQDQVDRYPTQLLVSPALTAKLVRAGAAGFTTYALRLDHAADTTRAEHQIVAALPRGETYNFHLTSIVAAEVEQAMKPESIAFGVFGAIAALATLLIVGQAIARAVRANAPDVAILRSLGAGPVMTTVDSILGVLIAVILGGVLAAVVSVLLSPVAPVGAVRAVDPSPGFRADWVVLGVGLGFLLLCLFAVSLAVAAGVTLRAARPHDHPARNRSSIADAAVRAGLPPSAVNGILFAIDRGAGAIRAPVGSTLLGAVLAVAVAVATLTFGDSLSTLVSHPNLYGWNWDYAIEQQAGGSVPVAATHLLHLDRDVGSWTGFDFGNASIDGQNVPILLGATNPPVAPPVLSGHGLETDRQIVMGASTLAQLHKRVGDTVTVTYGRPSTAPIYVPPTTLRIVGTTTLPAIGNTGTLHPSMGTGALVPRGIAPTAMRRALLSPDPNQNGPAAVVIRLRHGVAPAVGLASLHRVVQAANKVMAADPAGTNSPLLILSVQRPAQIVNYRTMGSTPTILASALALGAMLALWLALVSSVRRHRGDLALLKTLGLRPRQVAAVISWQSSVVALVGVAAGVPVGVVAGRWLWDLFARTIDAVPEPAVPVLPVVLIALGALVLANAVALVPGRRAARLPTAQLLRTE